jgi:MoCo/4Fe-4S cofactor protein with predicted Tat translocation signal
MINARIDPNELRRRQRAATDLPALWRSLDELAQDGAQPAWADELPARLAEMLALDRRAFLKLMGASLALAGIGGCSRQPLEDILPYAHTPPPLAPAQPLYFATSADICGAATGLLVQSTMGRPTKIEGNPSHPASLGATDIYTQASVLDVWDPDRSQSVLRDGQASTWDAFLAMLAARMADRTTGPPRVRILSESTSSPTLAEQIDLFLQRHPGARWIQYQPINDDHAYEGSRLAFGKPLQTRLHLDRSRVVLSLDADFIGPPGIRHARDFVASRRGADGRPDPGRLYVVEGLPTLTGAMADQRLAVRPPAIESVARAVASGLGLPVLTDDSTAAPAAWIAACVRDLQDAGARALVVAGRSQPPFVHALAQAMNHALGSIGTTISYGTPPSPGSTRQTQALRELAAEMATGQVDLLLILGGNPAYNAPADLHFAEHLAKLPLSVHLGLHVDETAALCRWHLPQAHFLESWSDTRTADGTAALQQPLMAPLYGGKSAHQLLAALLGQGSISDRTIVREHWRRVHGDAEFETFWNEALRRGVIEETRLPDVDVKLDIGFLTLPPRPATSIVAPLELVFAPDPTIWDGRYANNAWLQELPKPLTKLTWDNAATLSPATAARLGAANGDVITLGYRDTRVTAPVWIMPGQADATVGLSLGYGRIRSGRVGQGIGCNAYLLRHADEPWIGRALEAHLDGNRYPLAVTQQHHSMEGREPIRSTSFAEFGRDPGAAVRGDETPAESLYAASGRGDYAWAMSIDLGACIGCSACTIACQAENNIPVVGKDQVARGREMHWIRVDRYYQGDAARPRTLFQPVPCMHCEHAPCEAVCPVEATVHDSEGLNLQVYNRCVGTRFCSNNCPYKVRRFNFLQYADLKTESLKAQRNPEVTVRMRGVMEKCTYCVQRIVAARIEAEKADRRLGDGEVVTACQAVCPTGAIVFGDLNDAESRVSLAKRSPLNYALLAELNTRPRTSYLARVDNPHPDLEKS